MCTCVGVRVCVCMHVWVLSMHLYLFVCSVACYSVSDPFGEIRTQLQETRTRSRFVLVVDPIHRRFENRSMGWSVDQYRFVQWRPDGDSVSKPHHFMWMFVLVSFSFLPLLCFIRIISCDFILPVWLAVSLHDTLVIVHLICVIYMSLYQCHFMCW